MCYKIFLFNIFVFGLIEKEVSALGIHQIRSQNSMVLLRNQAKEEEGMMAKPIQ